MSQCVSTHGRAPLLPLPYRLARQPDSKLLENLVVDLAEHDGGVRLAAFQLRQAG